MRWVVQLVVSVKLPTWLSSAVVVVDSKVLVTVVVISVVVVLVAVITVVVVLMVVISVVIGSVGAGFAICCACGWLPLRA